MLAPLLQIVEENMASDLHLYVGKPPMMRVDGQLIPVRQESLTLEEMKIIIDNDLSPKQRERYHKTRDLDLALSNGPVRYRANFFSVRGQDPNGVPAAALRRIDTKIPSIDELHLPVHLKELAELPMGLVLVTGPTGSGKSTTLAAMIRHINDHHAKNIITIEDPVEYLHTSNNSLIRQRELGIDTASFARALKSSLRQDPDIILVGEMRDPETIALAVTAAETGHLVFATLHTRTASASIDRIIDSFPANEQEQIRVQLADTLEAIVSQALIRRPGGGRVAALEILRGTTGARALIRDGKTHQLNNTIITGIQKGNLPFEHSLLQLVQSGLLSQNEAQNAARDKEAFARLLGGGSGRLDKASSHRGNRDGGKMV